MLDLGQNRINNWSKNKTSCIMYNVHKIQKKISQDFSKIRPKLGYFLAQFGQNGGPKRTNENNVTQDFSKF